jgi:sulfate permease, SulP family
MTATSPAKPKAPSALDRWFPIAAWLPKYEWGKFLRADLIAAVSVAALLIPESMGYATVAGVPVQIGLYAAPLALVGYALFGGSRVLVFAAAGSVAAVSATVVAGLDPSNTSETVTMTAGLAVAAGAVFLVAGLARMGWISNFMSKSVMDGFITGMAVQIIVGQLANLSGITKGSGNTFQEFWSWLSDIGDWSWTATIMGVAAVALIFAIQRFARVVPAALTAVVLASIVVGLADPNIPLVSEIPEGLPDFGAPTGLSASDWATLVLGGGVVALVGFSEGWGAGTSIARKTHDSLNANQEFRSYGVGLMGSGLSGGMPVTGSLSKSSAAMTAGAKTQMTNILLAVIVLLTLLFLAPAFQWLPETVLAAVVINAMWGSANPTKVIKLWKENKVDFALGLITGLVVLGFDLLPAMVVGILLSIIYLVYRVSFPARAELGRDEKTGDFEALQWIHGAKREDGNPDAKPVPGVMVYRFSAPLVFSTAEAFKGSAEQLLIEAGAKGPLPKTLVIDCEEMFEADVTGATALHSLKAYTDRYDVTIALARLHTHARKGLADDGVLAEIGEDHVYDTVRDAVAAASPSDLKST